MTIMRIFSPYKKTKVQVYQQFEELYEHIHRHTHKQKGRNKSHRRISTVLKLSLKRTNKKHREMASCESRSIPQSTSVSVKTSEKILYLMMT